MKTKAKYEIFCQAHVDWVKRNPFLTEKAYPRYVTSSWTEARKLKAQADLECQSGAKHFVVKVACL